MKRKIDFIPRFEAVPLSLRMVLITGLIALTCLTAAAGELKLEIQRHAPFNLFDTDERIRFEVKPVGILPDSAEATVSLKNETGREVARRTVYDITGDFEVNVGKPGRGFFDLEVTVGEGGYDPAEQSLRSIDDLENLDEGSLKKTSARISLGVIDVVDRTDEEVHAGGYVFGLTWWQHLLWQEENQDVVSKLGIQRARVIQEESPKAQTEMEMARRIGRKSVVMYAHGVKAQLPQTSESSETTPSFFDDWVGYIRSTGEIKPAFIAHANAARMIDGSEYLGNLRFAPGVEAYAFDRRGENVLVLWTTNNNASVDQNEENTARKEVEVEVGQAQVLLTELLGREKILKPKNGKVKITLDEAPVYLSGFGDEVFTNARIEPPPDPELNTSSGER
ncbi:MAG: hypothetical protein PF795_08145 [Kiritimatiellae bacterium]|jgi:hypothetical protein|nr:hypothetical protein [Kiritimatiellia bacterium]